MSLSFSKIALVGLSLVAFAIEPGAVRATDLLELYTRATEFDPAYRSAGYRKELAQEIVREARSGILPTISANVETGLTEQNIKSSDNVLFQEGRSDFASQNFSISLTQPVYNPEAQVRRPQARAAVRRAAAEFAAAEQDLVFRLAEAHFSYLITHDALQFAAAERNAIEKQLEESQQRLDSGLGRVTAVHEARARFSLAQAVELDARDLLDGRLRAIAAITGTVPSDLAVLGESFPFVAPDQPDAEVWVKAALFQNPAIQALEAAVEVEEYEIKRRRGTGRRPRLDLVTAFSDRDSGGTVFGGGNDIVTADITLRLALPLYDGGRTTASTRSAVLEKQIRTQELETEKRRVERETRTALQGIYTGIARVAALRQSAFSQEAALAAKHDEFQAGIATRVELLDITRDLFSARRDLSQARYTYILHSLKLKQTAGILGPDDLQAINAYLQEE